MVLIIISSAALSLGKLNLEFFSFRSFWELNLISQEMSGGKNRPFMARILIKSVYFGGILGVHYRKSGKISHGRQKTHEPDSGTQNPAHQQTAKFAEEFRKI